MSSQVLLYIFVIPFVWLICWVLKGSRTRQVALLITSYVLYASWGLGFLGLLVCSSLVNYGLGAWLRRKESVTRLWVGIVLNVLLLGTFKYLPAIAPFLPHSSLSTTFASIVLPVGISFWTFQALSYLFDVYREEDIDPSLLEFLLYMAFWPTVLSGPICRLPNLLPQFRSTEKPTKEDVRQGLDRVFTGLFMIALGQLLAGGLHPGQGLDSAFDRFAGGLTGVDVWFMAIGYGFELFFNFAGYSHLVIGAARLFGFQLDENFNRPYFSTTPSEFWTRWHMSLSFWIRDYLFLPLAMLRREVWWRNAALLIAMVVFGLWHKGAVLFVLWGLYQGVLLVLHREWQKAQRRFEWDFSAPLFTPVSWLVTFCSICLGWIFFRANTLTQAFDMWRATGRLSTYASHSLPSELMLLIVVLAAGYFVTVKAGEWIDTRQPVPIPMEVRCALYSVAIFLGVFQAAQANSFIYFQF